MMPLFAELEQEVADLGLDKDKAFAAAFRLIRKYAEGIWMPTLRFVGGEYDRLEMFGASLLNALPTLVAAGHEGASSRTFYPFLVEGYDSKRDIFSAMTLQELEGRMKTE